MIVGEQTADAANSYLRFDSSTNSTFYENNHRWYRDDGSVSTSYGYDDTGGVGATVLSRTDSTGTITLRPYNQTNIDLIRFYVRTSNTALPGTSGIRAPGVEIIAHRTATHTTDCSLETSSQGWGYVTCAAEGLDKLVIRFRKLNTGVSAYVHLDDLNYEAPANSAPSASGGCATRPIEDGSVCTVNLTLNPGGTDNVVHTSMGAQPANGEAWESTSTPNTRYYYDPDPNFNGADSFRVSVGPDSYGVYGTSTISVDVEAVNDIHTLSPKTLSLSYSELVADRTDSWGTGLNAITVTDVDGGPYTVTIENTIAARGDLQWPNPDAGGVGQPAMLTGDEREERFVADVAAVNAILDATDFNPVENNDRPVSISVTVSDSTHTKTEIYTINVDPTQDDAPYPMNYSRSSNENGYGTGSVNRISARPLWTLNPRDPDLSRVALYGDVVRATLEIVHPAHAMIATAPHPDYDPVSSYTWLQADDPDDDYSFDGLSLYIDSDWHGEAEIRTTVTDSQGNSTEGSYTYTMASVPDRPRLVVPNSNLGSRLPFTEETNALIQGSSTSTECSPAVPENGWCIWDWDEIRNDTPTTDVDNAKHHLLVWLEDTDAGDIQFESQTARDYHPTDYNTLTRNNHLLQNLRFRPAANFVGNVHIVIVAEENYLTPTQRNAKTPDDYPAIGSPAETDHYVRRDLYLYVNDVNDAPTLTAPASISVNEDSNSPVFSNITVGDVDINNPSGERLTVDLVLNGGANDYLREGPAGASNSRLTGDGSGNYQIVGVPSAINARLDVMYFEPAANRDADLTLDISVEDGTATPVSKTVTLNMVPSSDAVAWVNAPDDTLQIPEFDGSPATGYPLLDVDDNYIQISDADTWKHDGSGNQVRSQWTVTVSLSDGDSGTLTGARFTPTSGSSLVVTSNVVGTVQPDGSFPEGSINRALQGLRFVPEVDYDRSSRTINFAVQNGAEQLNHQMLLIINIDNDVPTLDPIATHYVCEDRERRVDFTGVTTGSEWENHSLRVTSHSYGTATLPVPTVNFSAANAFGYLTLDPNANMNGTVQVRVMVTDDDEPETKTATRYFNAVVLDQADEPVFTGAQNFTTTEGDGFGFPFGMTDGDGSGVWGYARVTLSNTTEGYDPGNLVSAVPLPGQAEGSQSANTVYLGDKDNLMTMADLNAALGALAFEPTPEFHGEATITVAYQDAWGVGLHAGTQSCSPNYANPTTTAHCCTRVDEPEERIVAMTLEVISQEDRPMLSFPGPFTGEDSFTEDSTRNHVASSASSELCSAASQLGWCFSDADEVTYDDPTYNTEHRVMVWVEPARAGFVQFGGGTPRTFIETPYDNNWVYMVNQYLRDLRFTPQDDFVGDAEIIVVIDELKDRAGRENHTTYGEGNRDGGTPGAYFLRREISMYVSDVNDAPVLAPGTDQTITTNEDTATSPLAWTVTDADITNPGGERVTATLTLAPSQGVLTAVDASPAMNETGTDTGVYKISGTPAQVQASLRRVRYQPQADRDVDASFTVQIQDNSGGGDTQSALVTVNVDIVPTPDAVSWANAPANAIQYPEYNGGSPANGYPVVGTDENPLRITDADTYEHNDAGNQVRTSWTLTVSLSQGESGDLHGDGFDVASGDSLTITADRQSTINTALASLSFKPTVDYDENSQIDFVVTDNHGTLEGQISLIVTPDNDQPTLMGIATQSVCEDQDLTVDLKGISDGSVWESQDLALEANSDSVSWLPNPVVTFETASEPRDVVLEGSLVLDPNADQFGTTSVLVTATDSGTPEGEVGRTFTVNVVAEADEPIFSGERSFDVDENGGFVFELGMTDADPGAMGYARVTLHNTAEGADPGELVSGENRGNEIELGASDDLLELATLSSLLHDLEFEADSDFHGAATITVAYQDSWGVELAAGRTTCTQDFENPSLANCCTRTSEPTERTVDIDVNVISRPDRPMLSVPASSQEAPIALAEDSGLNQIAEADASSGCYARAAGQQGWCLSDADEVTYNAEWDTDHRVMVWLQPAAAGTIQFYGAAGTTRLRSEWTNIQAVNDHLRNLHFTPADEFAGPAKLIVVVDELEDRTGHEDPSTYADGTNETYVRGEVFLRVEDTNDAPEMRAPALLTCTEGNDCPAFAGDLAVADVDHWNPQSEILTVELTLADSGAAGILVDGATDGASFDNSEAHSGVYVVIGSQIAVNTTLTSLVLRPHTDRDADTSISVTVRDDSGDTPPGNGPVDPSLIEVDLVPVPDAVTWANAPADSLAYSEFSGTPADGYLVLGGDENPIRVTDPDTFEHDGEGNQIRTSWTLTVSLSQGAAGELYGEGFNVASGDSLTITMDGQSAINDALASLSFIPTVDYDQNGTIDFEVTDNEGTLSGQIDLIVTPDNDLPTLASISGQVVCEDATMAVALANISDGSDWESQHLAVGAESDNPDSLGDVAVNFTTSNSPRTAVLEGELSLAPVQDQVGIAEVTVTVKDLGDDGSPIDETSESFAVTIIPEADAPEFNSQSDYSTGEDITLDLILSMSDADLDASGYVRITLNNTAEGVSPGALSYQTDSGDVDSRTAPASELGFGGRTTLKPLSELNDLLSTVQFHPHSGFHGEASISIAWQDAWGVGLYEGDNSCANAQNPLEPSPENCCTRQGEPSEWTMEIGLEVIEATDPPQLAVPATGPDSRMEFAEDTDSNHLATADATAECYAREAGQLGWCLSDSDEVTYDSDWNTVHTVMVWLTPATAGTIQYFDRTDEAAAFLRSDPLNLQTANDHLRNITFTPNAHWVGEAKLVIVADELNSRAGYDNPATYPPTTSDTASYARADLYIEVLDTNDRPVLTRPESITCTEDSPCAAFGSGLAVADNDSTNPGGETLTVALVLDEPEAGALVAGAGASSAAGLTESVRGTYSVSGSEAAVNQTLAAIAFEAVAEYDKDTSLSVTLADPDETLGAQSVAINITPVADAAFWAVGPQATLTLTESELEPGTAGPNADALHIADTDGGFAIEVGDLDTRDDAWSVVASLSDADSGQLWGTNFTVTNGDALSLDATTDIADVQAALQNLWFEPAKDYDIESGQVIRIVVTDNSGELAHDVALDLTAVNDDPVAFADEGTTDEDTPASFDVLSNDTDVDNTLDEFIVSLASAEVAGSYGVATVQDNEILYTPHDHLHTNGEKVEVIDYTVSDGVGGSSQGTLTLAIERVPDTPEIDVAATITTDEEAAIAIPVEVDDNDSLAANDDGDVGRVEIALSNSDAGHLSVEDDQTDDGTQLVLIDRTFESAELDAVLASLTFHPAEDFDGELEMTIDVVDSDGETAEALVAITVNDLNDDPTIDSVSHVFICEDSPLEAHPFAGVSDGSEYEEQRLAIETSSSAASLLPDPTVTYTSPEAEGSMRLASLSNQHGNSQVTVTVNEYDDDTLAASVETEFTVTVLSQPDEPVFSGEASFTIDEDTGLNLEFGISDEDVNDEDEGAEVGYVHITLDNAAPGAPDPGDLVLGDESTNDLWIGSPSAMLPIAMLHEQLQAVRVVPSDDFYGSAEIEVTYRDAWAEALANAAVNCEPDYDNPTEEADCCTRTAELRPAQISLTIEPINDRPIVTMDGAFIDPLASESARNIPFEIEEEQSSKLLGNLVVSDADPAEELTITMTLDHPERSEGLSTNSGQGETYANGVWRLENASVESANLALSALNFLALDENEDPVVISILVEDGLEAGQEDGPRAVEFKITVAVDTEPDPPEWSANPSGVLTFTEDQAFLIPGLAVRDVDSSVVNLRAVVPDGSAGTVTAAPGQCADATKTWEEAGAVIAFANSDILPVLMYCPPTNFDGDSLLKLTVWETATDPDTGAELTLSTEITLELRADPQPDAPVVLPAFGSVELPREVDYTEDVAPFIALGDNAATSDVEPLFTVSDPDTGDTFTISLSIDSSVNASLTSDPAGLTEGQHERDWQVSGDLDTVNAAMATLRFVPEEHWESSFDLSVTIEDDTPGDIIAGVIQVNVNPVNDSPVATLPADLDYEEDAVDGMLVGSFDVVDPDAGEELDVTVTVMTDYGAVDENGAIGTLEAGDSGEVVSNLGIWEFTGTVVEVNEMLDTLRFNPTTDNQLSGKLAVLIEDGEEDGAVPFEGEIGILVTPLNDPPVIAGVFAAVYVEDSGLMALAETLELSDVDSNELDGATITFTSGFSPDEDELDLLPGASIPPSISSRYRDSDQALSLTGTASVADYQRALRAVAYENENHENPSSEPRALTIAVVDGEQIATAVISVTIQPVNDAPIFEAEPDPIMAIEGTALEFTPTVRDPEGQALTFSAEGLPTGAVIAEDTGVVSWTPTYNQAELWVSTLTASDGDLSTDLDVTFGADYIDEDDDGLPDTWENGAGLDNESGDSDGDTISDLDEIGDWMDPTNTDGEDEIDALDTDSDNDGYLDIDEAGDDDLSTPAIDTDEDGIADFRDTDSDNDDVPDDTDNCRVNSNTGQEDLDQDGDGNPCDEDIDGDEILNIDEDAFGTDPYLVDSDGDFITDTEEIGNVADPSDTDSDDILDALDDDSDGDGYLDIEEAGDTDLTTPAIDTDEDGIANFQDFDSDGDGIDDITDTCHLVVDEDQADTDGNGEGDLCADDIDGDGVPNDEDVCVYIVDPDQPDLDGDGEGDDCDGDVDGDELLNDFDVCPEIPSDDQTDTDGDGDGDECDDDVDGDGIIDFDPETLEPTDACPYDMIEVDEDGIATLIDGQGVESRLGIEGRDWNRQNDGCTALIDFEEDTPAEGGCTVAGSANAPAPAAILLALVGVIISASRRRRSRG